MKINTTNTTNKNKKRVAITTIICAMVVFAMVVVGCGIKKNSTVAEAEAEAGAEADVIATVGTTIDTTETVEETTETIVEETTETVTTETVEEEPSEEPSVETPSENTTTETEKPSETPSTTPSENKPSNTTTTTTETPSVPSEPTHNEPTTTETTTETPSEPTPNVETHWCGTPMQMMSGYIFHPAEGYYALMVRFSNGEKVPYVDKGDSDKWISDYMIANGITSYSIAEDFIVTTPEWREENVTQMCCPSCRYADNGFVAY